MALRRNFLISGPCEPPNAEGISYRARQVHETAGTSATNYSKPCEKEGPYEPPFRRIIQGNCLMAALRGAALLLILSVVTIVPPSAIAQNRFTKLSAEAEADDYLVILRRVFHFLYSPNVVVSELVAVGTDIE